MPIPNIIHFIYFGFTDFYLHHFLAIVSAYKVHKPDTIYLYTEKEPVNNFYFECAKKYVTIVKTKSPDEFQNVKLTSYQYKADIVRMEKLIDHGGIYMDIDVLSLKPFGELLNNKCVVGAESAKDPTTTKLEDIGSITNAVLLCEKDNDFIKFWYGKIGKNLLGKAWAYHAVCLPREILIEERFDTVKIEPKSSFMPFCFRDAYIFDESQLDKILELKDSYVVHLWETIWYENFLSKINISYFNKPCIFSILFGQYLDILHKNIEILEQIIDTSDNNLIENCKIYIDLCEDSGEDTPIKIYYMYVKGLYEANLPNSDIIKYVIENYSEESRKGYVWNDLSMINLNDFEKKIYSQNGEDGITEKIISLIYGDYLLEKIIVGSSKSNTKIISISKKYNVNQKLYYTSFYPDKFDFKFIEYNLIVTRTDQKTGWDQELVVFLNKPDKFFVEFGVENGVECNTRILREKYMWDGLMMDGNNVNVNMNLQKEFIIKDNIVDLLKKYNTPKHINLLSVDIDYNDFYCLKEILKEYEIDIIICEYNATHLPNEDKIIIYKENGCWDGTNYYGTSLLSVNKLCEKYNYSLVCCDKRGVNCFFIRNDILTKKNIKILNCGNVNKLYMKPRYGWGPRGGHRQDNRNRKYIDYNEAILL